VACALANSTPKRTTPRVTATEATRWIEGVIPRDRRVDESSRSAPPRHLLVVDVLADLAPELLHGLVYSSNSPSMRTPTPGIVGMSASLATLRSIGTNT
jgi:hypothetical protein